jgi:hypothetical protein
VLKPKEPMTPAPLVAPRRESFPVSVAIAVAAAALLLIAAIVLLLRRRRPAPAIVVPQVPPAERFRAVVLALRDERDTPERWAKLADALRDYLAETSGVGRELTTAEVLARRNDDVVATILRHGDLEKFSPWGTDGDFQAIAGDALRLAA